MNKKGFTLIELIAAIAIFSIISAIAAVSYITIMNNTYTKAYENYRDTFHAETISYVTTYPDRLTWNDNTARVLITSIYIDPINNPKNPNDLCENSYVDLTRSYSESGVLSITYNVCLKCNDFDECKEYEN